MKPSGWSPQCYFTIRSKDLRPGVMCVLGGPGEREQCGAELPELSDRVPGGCFRHLPQLCQ